MKLFNLIPILIFSFACNAHSETWTHDGPNARVHKEMVIDNKYKTYNTLNIEFNYRSKCRDAFISIIVSKDKKLGKHKSHDFKNAGDKKNRLNFYFNKEEFIYSAEKTIRSVYENGVEFGTLPSFNLIEKITQHQGVIDVYIGDTPLIRLENADGLRVSMESAKRFCLIKTKQ